MKHRHLLLASAIAAATLALAACKKEAAPGTDTASSSAPAGETADQFVARINAEFKAAYPEMTSAQWLSSTYINSDSERIAAKANERSLTQLNSWIEQAAKFDGKPMSEDSKRAIHLLKLMSSMPAPRDPAKLAELTQIATRMEGSYGAGKYCTDANDPNSCRQLGELEQVLARSRDYDKQLDAWQGWHSTTKNMRGDYQKFVGLVNEGAKGMGFTDAGQMWRSGYDMPPEQIGPETDRLWEQVKPMYEQLHCYARGKLDKTYGKDKAEVGNGLIAAHLLGNMWQQDWSNLWDQLEPYPGAGSLDITAALEKQYQTNLSAALAKAGVGHWVAPAPIRDGRFFALGDAGEPIEALQAMFALYGYDQPVTGRFDEAMSGVVTAFQRHFRPARIDGVADSSTITTLRDLIARQPA